MPLVIPQEGKVYKLYFLDKGEKLVFTAEADQWVTVQAWNSMERQKWLCTFDRQYGLGMKNVSTGKWMGFNTDGGWMFLSGQHRGWESFTFTPVVGGGYRMSVCLSGGRNDVRFDKSSDKLWVKCDYLIEQKFTVYLEEITAVAQ